MTSTVSILRTGTAQTPDRSLDPATIEFGRWCTPNFFNMEYRNGAWQEPRVEPVRNFSMHPASLVFHYAQAIFEGLKAFRWADGTVALFRPEANAKRLNRSARRMDMPEVPEELFVESVSNLVDLDRAFVPGQPGSLYLRPTMIATEACIGVRGATEFLFYVLALPSGSYFKEAPSGLGTVIVDVAEHSTRAGTGGTGNVKAAANYAVTLKTINDAKRHGSAQVLYLDAKGNRLVEEMGGMNIFFVDGGTLVTPPLNDTILAGVTRDSILRLAERMNLPVAERAINIDEAADGIDAGRITEAFACGTAAVVTGISEFRFEDGRKVPVGAGGVGPVSAELFRVLQGIQFGTEADPFRWVHKVQL